MISKIKLEKIQKLLTLELFMCLRLKLSKINKLFITNNFFFSNFLSQIFVCKQHFSLNFHNFFHFFSNKNCQVWKSETNKTSWLGGYNLAIYYFYF